MDEKLEKILTIIDKEHGRHCKDETLRTSLSEIKNFVLELVEDRAKITNLSECPPDCSLDRWVCMLAVIAKEQALQ